jgi:DNA mismatch repair protein MutL
MPQIQQLSASVINKIAAGEVIERPASVVKELMENALDAGATRIEVSAERGGSDLVRIVDNGHGIPPGELPLAVASHATSKIRTADDLFRVFTLGFRGEALASIAEVSRLTLRSRTSDSAAGAELEVNAGSAGEVAPCGCAVGTSITVRGLFFNTPVRRKFLKSVTTEMGHITEAFTRLALAHTDVHFTLKHNERVVFDLPAGETWSARIARFYGQELAEQLIGVESQDGPVRLWGYVAHPSHSRANPRMQYLFLNGRHIRDRSLQHALTEAYRGLLLTGRYPISFLCFQMPPEMVDVNVHPTKLEVRFQDGSRLYSQLLGTLRTKFLTSDLTARLKPVGGERPSIAAEQGPPEFASQSAGFGIPEELVAWARSEVDRWGASETVAELGPARQATMLLDHPLPPRQPLELNLLPHAWSPARSPTTGEVAPAAPRQHSAASPNAPITALQVHNRYLIAETPEGLEVIDQHALHERILYEQLREKVLAGVVETQPLLVPEPVDLTPQEAARVLDQCELLARLGVRVEAFGGGTVLVSSYPAMLANLSPAAILRDLVERLMADGKAPDRRDMLDELLHMVACKAAIKAGDRLTHAEITALLEQRRLVRDDHHCPHGRPTALVFTREELDRQFKRT